MMALRSVTRIPSKEDHGLLLILPALPSKRTKHLLPLQAHPRGPLVTHIPQRTLQRPCSQFLAWWKLTLRSPYLLL